LVEETPHPWSIIAYEELLLRPEEALMAVFQAWGLDVDINAVVSQLKVPSSTVYESGISGLSGWRKQLTDRQVSRIINTIERFGVRFYSRDVEPNYDVLQSGRLSEEIRQAGTG
jgi:hypothetical protein